MLNLSAELPVCIPLFAINIGTRTKWLWPYVLYKQVCIQTDQF